MNGTRNKMNRVLISDITGIPVGIPASLTSDI